VRRHRSKQCGGTASFKSFNVKGGLSVGILELVMFVAGLLSSAVGESFMVRFLVEFSILAPESISVNLKYIQNGTIQVALLLMSVSQKKA